MCARYEISDNLQDFYDFVLGSGYHNPAGSAPRYNIAPTQKVPVVRLNASGQRESAQMRWGLIPRWAKDASIGQKMINARSETVAEKPSFRAALKAQRCLVPATGFYEWKREGASKQPYHFRMKDQTPFAFAGLWENWTDPEGMPLDSCTIITTGANELVKTLHDRMPVILPRDAYAAWLDLNTKEPARLLAPFPADAMEAVPVSKYVNNVRNEGPECLMPA